MADLKAINLAVWTSKHISVPCNWIIDLLPPELFTGDVQPDLAVALRRLAYYCWSSTFVAQCRRDHFQRQVRIECEAMLREVADGNPMVKMDRASLQEGMLEWAGPFVAGARDDAVVADLRKKWTNFSASSKWKEIEEEWENIFTWHDQERQIKEEQHKITMENHPQSQEESSVKCG